MTVEHHPLLKEFPEYHDRIHQLKMENAHFKKLFDEYHEVDKEVYRMDENIEPVSDDVMEELKKRRLALKDELYAMLKGD
jgi:uncharacterized protein YdcH (DUF465 family)